MKRFKIFEDRRLENFYDILTLLPGFICELFQVFLNAESFNFFLIIKDTLLTNERKKPSICEDLNA